MAPDGRKGLQLRERQIRTVVISTRMNSPVAPLKSISYQPELPVAQPLATRHLARGHFGKISAAVLENKSRRPTGRRRCIATMKMATIHFSDRRTDPCSTRRRGQHAVAKMVARL